jgi:hypothetical protein
MGKGSNHPMTQSGWKFTVVNSDRYLVRVGIVDLERAKGVALKQCEGGQIKKHVQLSALEVAQLNISGGYSVTKVRSGNESRTTQRK